jgi:hypothetical protein
MKLKKIRKTHEIYANVYVGSGDAQIRSGAYFSAFKLIG